VTEDPRPTPRRRLSDGVRTGAARLRTDVGDGLRALDDRLRAATFVSATETVRIDARRHALVLVLPALRTLAGTVVLAAGPRLSFLLVFGLLTAVWAASRLRAGLRTTGSTALAATAALAVLDVLWGPVVCLLLLLSWALEDGADWYCDRLVVTDKRLYRRYGVLTSHSPSISLTAIAYVDASVPPLGRLLGYGTLSLDSVAQRDAPLSRFDHVPDVVPVSHQILELRSRAMPRFPQQPT
jgi:uncharacterized membrane protein YdbT with pleckstrin-like domain